MDHIKSNLSQRILLFKILLISVLSNHVSAQEMNEMWGKQSNKTRLASKESESVKLFRDGNYGLFLHWGLYSHLEGKWNGKTYYGIGEWIMHPSMAGIPVDDYMASAANFNPVNFDAEKIVKLACDAGMKYIILTAKHHEGFAMFHSEADSFNIVDATPFDRDPLLELSRECQRQGIGLGFYYSQSQDWTAPGAIKGPKTDKNGNEVSFDDYFYRKCLPQVTELCTKYGPISLIWFDTPGNISMDQVLELYNTVKKYQPDALISGRIGHNMGDYRTLGDMEIPSANAEGLWEACDVINDTWGYNWFDKNWKTPKEVVTNLLSTVARGGTYLLNVGPAGDGSMPREAVYSLEKAGEWIKRYPQVVYGSGASPWGKALPWGDAVVADSSLYLLVFDMPVDNTLYLHGLKNRVESMNLLNGDKATPVTWENNGDWLKVNVPAAAQGDDYVNVIKVELDGNEAKADTALFLSPNSPVKYGVEFATASDSHPGYHNWKEKFGEWKHAHFINKWGENGKSTWEVEVMEPGYYQVELEYSGEKRVVWRVTLDNDADSSFIQNQQGALPAYMFKPIGWIYLPAGRQSLSVSLVEGNRDITALRSIRLSPVK